MSKIPFCATAVNLNPLLQPAVVVAVGRSQEGMNNVGRWLIGGEEGVPVDLVRRVLGEREAGGLVPRRLAEVQLLHLRHRRRLGGGGRGRGRARGLGGGLEAAGRGRVVGGRRRGAVAGGGGRRRGGSSCGGGGGVLLGALLGRGDVLAERLELGVDGGVERAPGGGVVGEVEARRVAAEAVGGLVVGERRFLGGVEGAEPEAGAVPREADLGDPLAPVPLPHAAVQLLRTRRGRGRRRGRLHGLGPRAQHGGLLRLALQVEAGLDVLHLGWAQLARPLGRGGGERVPAVGGGVVEGERRRGTERLVVGVEERTGSVRSRGGIPDKRLECSHQLLP